MKALQAGKHVLNEKSTVFTLAEEKGLVLLNAYHYRYSHFRYKV